MNISFYLSSGNTSYQIEPKPVMGMDGMPIAQIAAGGWHSLALTGDGKVGYRVTPRRVHPRVMTPRRTA